METKHCNKCDTTRPTSDFNAHKVYGLQDWCRSCQKAYRKTAHAKAKNAEWRQRNRESINAGKRKYYHEKERDTIWERNIRNKFGITAEQYYEMYDQQNGVCATCHRPHAGYEKRLAVDHCHTTGKVRGLLCEACNRAIGMLGDNLDVVMRVHEYLRRNK